MAKEAPSPSEVTEFSFRQLRRIKIIKDGESIPSEALNIVATSSKYGLVFVGIEGGFKVLKLENILDLDEDKDKRRIDAEQYSYQKVVSPTPSMLSLSADDMTLAVCVSRDGCAVADMYDIRIFADQDETPIPFLNVQLSSLPNVLLKDFIWNPVAVEMYAYCLSDGSMHVHELVETTLKIVGNLPPQTGATTVCWSPKGKQVVVGKKDGSFSQYKPTLQEVKIIPPPKLEEENIAVSSICWISTTLFATVYTPSGNTDDKTSFLVFVSTPKGADIAYTNFNDVCFGGGFREPRYIMHYQPEWGILICSSANSLEAAVVGCQSENKNVWQQWILDGTGRAELPLFKNEETYPLGMNVIFCAQRKIVISDTESYPPMPIILFLSTSALLCPFHMLNVFPGAANIVYPSEPICTEGERKRKEIPASPAEVQKLPLNSSPLSSVSSSGLTQRAPQLQPEPLKPNLAITSQVPSTTIVSTSPVPSQVPLQQNTSPNRMSIFGRSEAAVPVFLPPQSNQTPSIVSAAPKMPSQVTVPFVMGPQQEKLIPGSSPFQNLPNSSGMGILSPAPVIPIPGASPNPLFLSPLPSQLISAAPLPCNTPVAEVKKVPVINPAPPTTSQAIIPINNRPAALKPISVSQRHAAEAIKKNETKLATQDAFVSAALDEIAEFQKELNDLKKRISNSQIQIGTKEEMSFLKESTMLLTDFHSDMSDTMQSINTEIHSLRNLTLEAFAMIEEARSRSKRNKDPKYLSLLRGRALDPISARRMQKIRQISQYLECQLREVHDRLDQDWNEFLEKNKRSFRKHRLPSTEAVYRTMVHNQNIIYNQRSQLDQIALVLRKIKLEGCSKGEQWLRNSKMESLDGELATLADSLLNTKVSNNGEDKNNIYSQTKVLSPQKQAILRDMLSNRKITPVKPTVIYEPAQSRLVSTMSLAFPEVKKTEKVEVKELNGHNIVDRHTVSLQPMLQESIPENIPMQAPLQIKPVSAFTTKPVIPAAKGGITQGIPVTTSLNRPIPNPATTQAFASNSHLAFKAVQSKSPEPTILLLKDPSQSAFTHLALSSSKSSPELQRLPSSNSAISSLKIPAVSSHSTLQQKPAINSGYISPLNVGEQPSNREVSSANNFVFKLPESSFMKNTSGVSTSANSPFALGATIASKLYENISPPDTPHLSDEEDHGKEVSEKQTIRQDQINSESFQDMSKNHGGNIEKMILSKEANSNVILFASGDATSPLGNSSISSGSMPFSFSLPSDMTKAKNSTIQSNSSISSQYITSSPENEHLQPSGDSNIIVVSTSKNGQVVVSSVSSPVLPSEETETNNKSSAAVVASNASLYSVGSPPSIQNSSLSNFSFVLPNSGAVTVPSDTEIKSVSSDALPTTVSSPVFNSESVVPTTQCEEVPSTTTTVANTARTAASPVPLTLDEKKSSTNDEETVTSTTLSEQVLLSTNTSVSPSPNSPVTTSASPVRAEAPTPSTLEASTNSLFEQLTTSGSDQGQVSTSPLVSNATTSVTPSTSSSAIFGQSSNSTFGQTTTTSASKSLFGQQVNSSSTTVFGQSTISTTPFAQNSVTSSQSVFGQSTSVPTTSVFGQNVTTSSTPTLFGQKQVSASFFGQQSTTQSSFFSKASPNSPVFGQAPSTQSSVFGQPVTSSPPFGQGTGNFFSQSSPVGSSLFGQKATPNSNSVFGQTASPGFTFGQSGFGQNSSSFGQNKPLFGQSGSSVFGQSQTPNSSPFGQSSPSPSGGTFGQTSGFFSGLGGKPSAENASKNVFGSSSFGAGNTSNSLFGNQGASTFGTKLGSFAGGSFSAGGGSVAQSGFGAFQQTPEKAGNFASPPAFGGSPTFGGSATFGSSPTFGNNSATANNSIGVSSFGTQQASGFGNFASTNSPTFGTLASQTPGFNNSQSGTFGGSVFGSSPSFGGQSPGFGTPTPTPSPSGASAFSQWRQ